MVRHSARCAAYRPGTPPLTDVRWMVVFCGNVVMEGYLEAPFAAPKQIWSRGPCVARPATWPQRAGWVLGGKTEEALVGGWFHRTTQRCRGVMRLTATSNSRTGALRLSSCSTALGGAKGRAWAQCFRRREYLVHRDRDRLFSYLVYPHARCVRGGRGGDR
jgi:hypothetical protein